MHPWPDLGFRRQQNFLFHWNDLSIGLQYCSPQKFLPLHVSGRDSFLEPSVLISFQKSLHSPLWSFDSIFWERSWSSISLKKFIFYLKATRAQHFSSASGPLLGRPEIFQRLAASCIEHSTSLLALHTLAHWILKVSESNYLLAAVKYCIWHKC